MTKQEIMVAISKIDNMDDLRQINEWLMLHFRSLKGVKMAVEGAKFRSGDRVTFFAKGRNHSGVVQRVNQKTVTLVTDKMVTWRVSPTLLKKAA